MRSTSHKDFRPGYALSRRQFIRTTAGAAAGVALGGLAGSAPAAVAARRNRQLPTPQQSGLEHVVLVMMENRSFDHFLGWLPGANGRQAGLTYYDKANQPHPTWDLDSNFQGCQYADPDHSYEGARVEYNDGAADGWLKAGSNDIYSIGYYTQDKLAFLGQAAPAWTTADNFFAAILAGTYPNRIYQHAAQTDRLDNSLLPISTLPTIWDRLADHSLSARYYFQRFSVPGFVGHEIPGHHPSGYQLLCRCTGGNSACSLVRRAAFSR
jgi:phospholipase C